MASVRVTAAYQRADRLPRKAINLLSAVVSEKVYQLDMGHAVLPVVTAADVARFFSEMSGVPADALDGARPAYYRALGSRLGRRVKGQGDAITAVTTWLSLHASGWVDQRRPRGRFLFLGPPGVGKTELALALADEVMSDRGSVIVLNMAEYQGDGARNKFLGADPGYVGFGETQTLFSRVMLRPFSLVVMDEFEKADPSLANSLSAILDGWAVDSQGRSVDFSQCIFVLISASVHGVLGSLPMGSPDVGDRASDYCAEAGDDRLRSALLALGGIWTAGLLDRIDRVCPFSPLGTDTLLAILDGLVCARREIASHPLPPELDDAAVRESILAEASAGGGAHPARRLERSLMRWLSARPVGGGAPA
jgi:ATP-dependent Clp protease ATP-binding subunit ClpC